jgi:hypothetical protein
MPSHRARVKTAVDAEVQSAETSYHEALDLIDRMTKAGNVSQSDLDTAHVRLKIAAHAVRRAKARQTLSRDGVTPYDLENI